MEHFLLRMIWARKQQLEPPSSIIERGSLVPSVLSSAVNQQSREATTHFLLVLHAHPPYQVVCGHLHAVLCMGQWMRTHWVIPATRTSGSIPTIGIFL